MKRTTELSAPILALALLAAACTACGPPSSAGAGEPPDQAKGAPVAAASIVDTIVLPEPSLRGGTSVEEALAGRRSTRSFADRALTQIELGQLLWAAQGITREGRLRTAPSAGALYPLELYVATAEGLFHYSPSAHRLVRVVSDDVRPDLKAGAYGQAVLETAPAVLIIAGVFERTAAKYGDLAPRFVHMEVGHAAQNALLQAVAMGLGGVPVGGFRDERVKTALPIPADQAPLYLVAVGEPRE
jgi:SagB-type dehydrogenase family enzyme